MKILAVEFSTSHRSVAIVEGCPGGTKVLGRAAEINGRQVIHLVEQALKQARCEREEIEVLAVGLGPGSYAGIRGGIALAQGWELGRNTRLLGLSSAECLAVDLQKAGNLGPINIIIDAQKNEFYVARYEIQKAAYREIEPLRLAPLAEIETRSRAEPTFGPDVKQWVPTAHDFYPDATTLGEIAARRDNFVRGEKLEPIYLRETTFKKAPPLRPLDGR